MKQVYALEFFRFSKDPRERAEHLLNVKRLHSDSILDTRTNVLCYNEECIGREQEKNNDERKEDVRENKRSMVTARNRYLAIPNHKMKHTKWKKLI